MIMNNILILVMLPWRGDSITTDDDRNTELQILHQHNDHDMTMINQCWIKKLKSLPKIPFFPSKYHKSLIKRIEKIV